MTAKSLYNVQHTHVLKKSRGISIVFLPFLFVIIIVFGIFVICIQFILYALVYSILFALFCSLSSFPESVSSCIALLAYCRSEK